MSTRAFQRWFDLPSQHARYASLRQPQALGPDWIHEPSNNWILPPPEKSFPSLMSLAAGALARNSRSMTKKHLVDLPRTSLEAIWREIMKRGPSFHEWKLFGFQLHKQTKFTTTMARYRYSEELDPNDLGLSFFTRPMTSLDLDFITHLILAHSCRFTASELQSLSDMRNLGILEYMYSAAGPEDDANSGMSDELIENWTKTDNAFPLLRMLRIWGRSKLSMRSVSIASQLPALIAYDIWACQTGHKGFDADQWAAKNGWHPSHINHHDNEFEDDEMGMFDDMSEEEEDMTEEDLVGELWGGWPEGMSEEELSDDDDLPVRLRFDLDPSHSRDKQDCSQQAYWTAQQVVKSSSFSRETAETEEPRAHFGIRRGSCHEEATWFDLTGFWYYAMFERALDEMDNRPTKPTLQRHVRANKLLLPSKPMACVRLGFFMPDAEEMPPWMEHVIFNRRSIVATQPSDGAKASQGVVPAAQKRRASEGGAEDEARGAGVKRSK